jgi:hypothetical protein
MKLVDRVIQYKEGVDTLEIEIEAVYEHMARILAPIVFELTGNPFVSSFKIHDVLPQEDGSIQVCYLGLTQLHFHKIPWEVAAAEDPVAAAHEYRQQLDILEQLKNRHLFHDILGQIRDEVNRAES